MAQAVRLDRGAGGFYYGVAVLGAALVPACVGAPRSIAPTGLVPGDRAAAHAWVATHTPSRAVRYDLRWRYTTQQGSSAGRAAVRIAPPDTLRFDYRGPFGRSGSALIVGDRVVWARPEDDATSLVPNAPIFWAALGIPVAPPAEADLFTRLWDDRVAWRYVAGGEELDFLVHGSTRLQAELRHHGRIMGSADVALSAGRYPTGATARFPPEATLFTFTVEAIDTLVSYDPATWRP